MTFQLHRTPRLYVDDALFEGAALTLPKDQSHYAVNVMRLKAGDALRLFNGKDGEWLAEIETAGKRAVSVKLTEHSQAQIPLADIHYLFAPLKHARLDYMVQKATELGVAVLQPVITGHTNVHRVKVERMRSNAIEAAEQCNLLAVPEVREPVKLDELLSTWDGKRRIIFCDEGDEASGPLDVLRSLPTGPLAVLIGPEGGFSEAERNSIRALPNVTAISLGPRIMRADTAAVAALSLVQAVLGDWT
ncbi:MAG: 16S rRNA (uracil(1498)-N(3))-methyltransferase [Hyphomicrobiales bacterium]